MYELNQQKPIKEKKRKEKKWQRKKETQMLKP
jgi:hypothetical protein